MGASRYGISPWAFNLISSEACSEWVRCKVEHEKRNSISTSNHVLHCILFYKYTNNDTFDDFWRFSRSPVSHLACHVLTGIPKNMYFIPRGYFQKNWVGVYSLLPKTLATPWKLVKDKQKLLSLAATKIWNFGGKSNGKVHFDPSDQNIQDHPWRWSTYFSRNIPTESAVPFLTNQFISLLLFTYLGNSEKE